MPRLQTLVDEIVRNQAGWTSRWHETSTPPPTSPPWTAIEQNHRMNFELWHEEDVARRDDLGPERVRQAKRAIDRCNQSRTDAIEQLDAWFLSRLPSASAASALHSETPGMMVDRLSILSLKLYHMRIEATRESAPPEHRGRCAEKCKVLAEQLCDLKSCLEVLLEELQAGSRRFKLYRQLKMYNDATLNPQLYGQGQPEA